MLEKEKKNYGWYRVDRETNTAKEQGKCRGAIYQTSDRRDVDNEIGGVFLKKTYYGVCDIIDIRSGDIVVLEDNHARIISVKNGGNELVLHLESVEFIDTGAYELEGEENV